VAVFVASTVALGITAPLESLTVPETLPPIPALASMEEIMINAIEREITEPLTHVKIAEDKVKTKPPLELNIVLLS